ncbi:MAG: xanthine dehydrogenase family protein molybdopterin-binding subunit, partial [Desulfobacteraceae bacterium]|nr:xanthine dehydrogenase family protein molybdopterin-binding subunit [Desulfobacteraceae bacterium]
MINNTNISRRSFIKLSAAAGAGLILAVYLWPSSRNDRTAQIENTQPKDPSIWLKIDSDNVVTIIVSKSEIGQEINTAAAMLVVEELEADWSQVRTETAPVDPVYDNPMVSGQMTAMSTSIRTLWEPLREAGAIAREMLIQAAAEIWKVNKSTCIAKKGDVVHVPSGKRLSFGSLSSRAAMLPIPQRVQLKDPETFHIIGKRIRSLDAWARITGSATFGSDIKVPRGMLIAVVSRCPVFGGAVDKFDPAAALAVNGVQVVVEISRGVAVIAKGVWSAMRGRQALEVTWEQGTYGDLDTASISEMLAEMSKCKGETILDKGNAEQYLSDGKNRVEAIYEFPYLAHATMEPLNCTADVTDNSCELWVPTQNQTGVEDVAAYYTGLPRSCISVHTTLTGGAFGRGQFSDHVGEAIEISKSVGAPIKVVWSREDDIRHDYYRPASYHRICASLNHEGQPTAWFHRIAGITDFAMVCLVKGAESLPYDIENVRVELVRKGRDKVEVLRRYIRNRLKGHRTYDGFWNSKRASQLYVPTGPWRSVGNAHNAFVIETFIDELAAKAGKDPYLYRRDLLGKSPRGLGVIDMAAEKIGWHVSLKKERHAGIAYYESFGSYVAMTAEVSLTDAGTVKLHRIVCIIDCGMVVNPDTIEAQIEGGVVFGLTAALKGKITISNGRVEQSNFHDYKLLRIDETPQIDVYVMPSKEPPGGIGELAVPPIAPTVANAFYSATGKRIRKLPFGDDGVQY